MPKIKVAELFVPIKANAKQFKKELADSSRSASDWAKLITKASAGVTFGTLIAGAGVATAGVAVLGKTLGDLAVEAAPLEGIGMTFSTMSQRFSVSIDEMRDAAAGLMSDFELMRKTNLALTGLTGELGTEFGAKLPELLMTARAAARSTGQSFEYMYNSLVNGIKRASPRLIDNTGIVIELGLANKKLASELGTTVEMMSEEEKALAALNAVTERGMVLARQMGLEHITASEALGQMRVSFRNAKDQIGLAFNPAVKAAAVALNDLINIGLKPLAPLLERTVAPAITVVIEKFHQMAVSAVESGKQVLSGIGDPISQAAHNALQWGVNISVNLAKGIITGAARALTAAMNFVSNMLSSWLAPGSPPRVAPELPEWGRSAMEEFLKGFTMANFDILEGTQSMLKKSLDALVEAGDLGEDVSERIFEGLSVKLIQAIEKFRETGVISQRLLKDLTKFGGAFGDELATLVERQFAFAQATDEVRRAEERLRASRRAEEKAQEKLNQQIEKYNDMLRGGASSAALRAQRERVYQTRREMELAEDQIKEAERQRDAAKERLGPLEDQIKLQERLLEQLIRFTDAQEEAEEGVGGGGGGGGGGGAGDAQPLPQPELGALPVPNFEPITQSFIDAKDRIEKALEGLFQPIKDALKDPELRLAIHNLKDAWHRLENTFKEFWDSINGDQLLENIKDLIPESLIENIGEVVGNLAAFAAIGLAVSAVVGILGGVLSILTSPIFLLVLAVGVLKTAWEENWFDIQGITQDARDFIVPKLEDMNRELGFQENHLSALPGMWTATAVGFDIGREAGEGLTDEMEALGGFIKEDLIPVVKDANALLQGPLKIAFRVVKTVANNFLTSATEIWLFLKTLFKPIIEDVADAFGTVWEELNDHVLPSFKDIKDFAEEGLTTALSNLKTDVIDPLAGAFGGVSSAIQDTIGFFRDLADSMGNWQVPDWAQRHSPSPFEQTFLGASNAIRTIYKRDLPSLRREMNRMPSSGALTARTPGMARASLEQRMAAAGDHYEYNLTMYTRAEQAVVRRGFEVMRQRVPGST